MNPFQKHPQDVGMTYFEHCYFAEAVAYKMITAGIACLIHAFLPFLFEKAASRTVKQLDKEFEKHYGPEYWSGGGI